VRLGYSQRKLLHRFEARRLASLSGLEEVLIADARAGLTPADMVERKVVHLLEGIHARLGDAESRVALRAGNQRRLILLPTKRRIQEEHAMRVIEQGDKVQVHYVKVFQDGSSVSSSGKAPTELTVGSDHPRLPGLGLALVGLTVGGSRTFIVPARDAYGPYNPRLIRCMARWRFAEHVDLSVGQWVRVWDRQCRRRLVRIVEIGEEKVLVDANHRWAGQSQELEVRVISIRGPEIASGADESGVVTSSTGSASRERSPGSIMPDGNRGGEKSCP
jgi:FKBP-type peptidyl-prolyl cis-trans isomerase 2